MDKNDMELVDDVHYWCEQYKHGDLNLSEFTFKVSKIINKLDKIQNKYLQHKI